MKKLAILIITGLFVSCQLILPPSASSETGHFSFEIPIGCVRDNSESLSLSFAFVNTDEEEELTYTILSLQSIGHQFVTVSIETDVGNYEIRKISIRNEADSIRAISPKVGSNKASLVSSPLPYRFSVFADSTAILSPDMLTFSGSDSPEDYGYSSFAMDVSILYPDFASSLNAFSFDIFREIVSDVDTGNIFISPVSVAYAFGLLYPGVRGTALEEIKDCFYLMTSHNRRHFSFIVILWTIC